MYQVDLNSDLGESFGRYTIGMDEKIIPLISSANIACGYHASDPVVMLESIAKTKEAGIKIGAHPGLPDLMGFGRRNMAISPAEAKAYTLYQISALGGMCQANGMRLQHVNHMVPYTTWLPKITSCLWLSVRLSATMILKLLLWDYPEVK